MVERRRILVEGVVQGVGFRPFVYRLAHEQELSGSVLNEGVGVRIDLQGPRAAIDEFVRRLHAELPPGARIDRERSEPGAAVAGESGFVIEESSATAERSVSIAPDRYVCAACLREMRDPTDRRHRYPFITCTHCGPRYTIAIELPYDRRRTTMAGFPLCAACLGEYQNPLDRRYHAEPIACSVCGPRVWLMLPADGARSGAASPPAGALVGDAALDEVRRRLERGDVVAIKGLGGFHLAVDARQASAVARLRERKSRPRKPLAVMARDLATARRIVELRPEDEELLLSPAAPIVLAPRREEGGVAAEVAPGLEDLGVMLPYSPLHHLLLERGPDLLVMTSGNHPSEPITTDNADALATLPADASLLHDRAIHVANDDSVVRSTARGPVFLRRSRGYVPDALDARQLPARRVLALGAVLKVAVATLCRGQLLVGRHLGDLDNLRAEAAFRQEVERMLRFGQVEPEIVAVDSHPDLESRAFAERTFAGVPLCDIQHHHAHLASVLVEHGRGPEVEAVGIVLDGFGHGPDGAVWGGEVLRGGYLGCERVAHLRYVPQPGGDRAALEPRRMATSLLCDAGLGCAGMPGFDPAIAAICGIKAVSPLTSSTGRLFDGVAALLGVAPAEQDYEGEAAARLEAVADASCRDAYPLPARDGELDTRVLVEALVRDRSELGVRAARFHHGLADGLADVAMGTGVGLVVLGGGSMVNRLLLGRLVDKLEQAGRTVLWPKRLPPGDGGLSAGQAACAACLLDHPPLPS
jgi:hydrogenase maturation protein HypF